MRFFFIYLFFLADKKWGKGKDKIDDEDITFQRMVAKVSGSALILLPVSLCFDLNLKFCSGNVIVRLWRLEDVFMW